ncbi:hypothetical protein PABY_16970 [Pyrodictium abyssi]|uniref:Uncharacterized protein n=1 Tax=Pyrodictium abyssi TaxID=54256 RepID=A0ABM8IX68_9CREN|nr:hypothetical protein PABY_16970 [Pyrodictium abyssi]
MGIVRLDIVKLLEPFAKDMNVEVISRGDVLQLPYKTRSINLFDRVIKNKMSRVDIGGKSYHVLVFLDEAGLRRQYYVCVGSVIRVTTDARMVSDDMSGLKLRVRAPVIVIDECRIELEWSRSRFVLTSSMIESCRRCYKVA